jgi:hypothetical protein
MKDIFVFASGFCVSPAVSALYLGEMRLAAICFFASFGLWMLGKQWIGAS